MDLKEEIKRAIKLEPLERVPTSIFGGGVWTIYGSGNTFEGLGQDPEKYAKILVSTQEKLQNNIVFVNSGYNNFIPIALGAELRPRSPFLSLAPEPKAPIIKSEEDLDKLDPSTLDQNRTIVNIRRAARMVMEELGGKVEVAVTCWGPFTLAGQMRGLQELLTDVKLRPELVKRILEKSGDLIVEFYKPYIEAGIDMCSIAEPTASGDMVSLEHFDTLVMPSLKRTHKGLKDLRVPCVFLHICGWTEDRLSRMPESGADIFSLDHRVDIGLARDALKDKICFAGNVDPVKVLRDGKSRDVEGAVGRCIEKAWYGRGFILMPGCDVAASVSYENLQTFLRAGREYLQKRSAAIQA